MKGLSSYSVSNKRKDFQHQTSSSSLGNKKKIVHDHSVDDRPEKTEETQIQSKCGDVISYMVQTIDRNGLTKSSQDVMNEQLEAAHFSMETGLYIVWRTRNKGACGAYSQHSFRDCSRIAPSSICFCGHPLKDHFKKNNGIISGCSSCKGCKMFEYIPTRPAETGEFWLEHRTDCK